MTQTPRRISVVVPTRNSGATIERCLQSVRAQTHTDVELVVVDNSSEDDTVRIAKDLADVVITAGPERSAQRNVGARASSGEVVVFIDSDMVLDAELLVEVERAIESGAESVVLPERIEGDRYWQRVRALEKALILGDPDIEAARAFPRSVVEEVGGYDESLVAGPEDWDLSDRVRARGRPVARTGAGITHVEEDIRLGAAFRKKRYYGTSVRRLAVGRPRSSAARMVRARFFTRLVRALYRDPTHALGLFLLKAVEFAGIGAGLLGWKTEGTRTVYSARPQRRRL